MRAAGEVAGGSSVRPSRRSEKPTVTRAEGGSGSPSSKSLKLTPVWGVDATIPRSTVIRTGAEDGDSHDGPTRDKPPYRKAATPTVALTPNRPQTGEIGLEIG